jgi:hypothetical protein
MELRSGIKLLAEIEGYGDPIIDNDRCHAVLKFYRNHGEPLIMTTFPIEPIPYIITQNGSLLIAWEPNDPIDSHIVIHRNLPVSRGADILPGIYYTLLGMRTAGYRKVAIPPHLLAHSMHEVLRIDRESVIKLECFVIEKS